MDGMWTGHGAVDNWPDVGGMWTTGDWPDVDNLPDVDGMWTGHGAVDDWPDVDGIWGTGRM